MGSINLSQSIQEKQALARGKFFDKGFFINATILLIIVSGYGGSIWYLDRLEDELAALQTSSADKTATLKGPEVNRAADIRERINVITQNLTVNPDPRLAFLDLERVTLSTIQIRQYRRVESEQMIIILGVTDNLRYLAQQMLAFKRLEGVQSVHVQGIKYDKESGRIEFELNLVFLPAVSDQTEVKS